MKIRIYTGRETITVLDPMCFEEYMGMTFYDAEETKGVTKIVYTNNPIVIGWFRLAVIRGTLSEVYVNDIRVDEYGSGTELKSCQLEKLHISLITAIMKEGTRKRLALKRGLTNDT